MHLLETYLKSLHDIHLSGQAVPETSYYGPIAELLNELGKTLDPKVSCVINLKNKGAGIPDGGLFTADQLKAQKRKKAAKGDDGPLPARGVLEIKGPEAEVMKVVETEQVAKYLKRYGQVLVTNYRDFVLLTRGDSGEMHIGERYVLANTDKVFWKATAFPEIEIRTHGVPFIEYLKRVMLHRARIDSPKDLAWFLASYARDALARIELDAEQPSLATIRKALEQGLGISFTGEKGEHFFRSTLVQTLFYGLFSAWVLWSRQQQHSDRKARFHWKEAAWTLHVPAIKVLFEQLATPTKLGQLDLVEVLEWSEEALNRVDRAAFFATFEQARAVQYFYEPFLAAFDPELRKELGVWYTPHEVVQYMVARVDTVLREQLKIADGLADPRVVVLDPCCGTGAYLVEVLRTIDETLKHKGGDALLAQDLKEAAINRIFGFEILPAPFVVSHLQLNLMLQRAGAPIDAESEERVGVYLTNALTGWEPAKGPKQHMMWPELEEERNAADEVKQKQPILVILGNPPYNGFAGMAVAEERALTDAYRETVKAPKPQGQGLNDLYVRFFRMAERKIVGNGEGVVCFISNYSWLDGLSFTGMRERYLQLFDSIWVDCLNGDKFKTGKTTPEGAPDPSIFSTEQNREGIQVGTAVSLLVRKKEHHAADAASFRHFWGAEKRNDLLGLAEGSLQRSYDRVLPEGELGFPLVPMSVSAGYTTWPLLPDLFPVSFPGVKTSRDDALVDIEKERLVTRIEQYFDSNMSDEAVAVAVPGIMDETGRYDPRATRKTLLARGFLPGNIVRYAYRPFDLRWLYWEPETKLLDEKRTEYFPHVDGKTPWIEARQKQSMEAFDRGYLVRVIGDNFGNGLSSYFPLYLKTAALPTSLFQGKTDAEATPNLSPTSELFLAATKTTPESLFLHALASLHSSAYRSENGGTLRQDWPRIPLPSDSKRLKASSALGQQLAVLLDPETPAPGVSQGTIRPELKLIGPIGRHDGKSINTKAGDLKVTAGWGHAGKAGVTMPGRGKLIERGYTKEERTALDQAEVGAKVWLGLLGETTCDVFLNDVACWTNIPIKVWEYTLGGYQVIKKWLSYREHELLGRSLTVEEARYVTEMTRRIAVILLLGPALDANYEAVKRDTWAWPGAK